MGLRKRVEDIEGKLYPQYTPFTSHIGEEGLIRKVKRLERDIDNLWEYINDMIVSLNLDVEKVPEHWEFKKKKNANNR